MRFSYALAILAFCFGGEAHAIDLDAGDCQPAPPGTTLVIVYGQHIERRSEDSDADIRARFQLDTDLSLLRIAHYVDIGGVRVAPNIIIPVARTRFKDHIGQSQTTTGVGDVILALPVWLLNSDRRGVYFGITPYLQLPTGGYQPQRIVNIGSSRAAVTVQAVGSARVSRKVMIDAAADVSFFGRTSRRYLGGQMSSQPGYQLQASARYFLSDGIDLRAGISRLDGGAQTQNAQSRPSFIQDRIWVGTSFPITSTINLVSTVGTDLAVRNGFRENLRLHFRIMKRL